MPHFHRATCKVCGRHESEVGRISATGKCAVHSEAAYLANHRQLKAHRGPYFEHWLARCRAAFGVPSSGEVDSPADV